MNEKQKRILKDKFSIYKDCNTWDLEQWTDGGVDMFITIDTNKNIVEELENYIENFDIDEEIELCRQDENYKNNFTIRESLNDFENWVEYIEIIIKQLKGCE